MSVTNSPISDAQVAAKFASYPAPMRERLMFLRQLVLDTATRFRLRAIERLFSMRMTTCR